MRSITTYLRTRSAMAISGLLFVIFAMDVSAQSSRSQSATARRVDEFNKQGNKAVHDEMNRDMRKKKPSKEALQRVAQLRKETKEDLEILQDNYNLLIVQLTDRRTPTPVFISEIANSIESSATRLKANLALPKPDKDENFDDISVPKADLDVRIRTLCAEIYALLTSPAVENPNVIDIAAATATHEKLKRIITLSEILRNTPN